MSLTLEANVVYALLATIVAIVLIVNITRLIRLHQKPALHTTEPKPYNQEDTQTWPASH